MKIHSGKVALTRYLYILYYFKKDSSLNLQMLMAYKFIRRTPNLDSYWTVFKTNQTWSGWS